METFNDERGNEGTSMPPMFADQETFPGVENIYRRYRTQARRTASRYYPGDAAAVEDVVQDVFVSLCEVFERIDTTKSLAGWVGRVTANRCLSKRRREIVAATWQQSAQVLTNTNTDVMHNDLEARVAERDDLSHLLETLDRLSEKQAYAFRQYYFHGVEQGVIAARLGVTKGYVSKMIKSARNVLRQEIGAEKTRVPH